MKKGKFDYPIENHKTAAWVNTDKKKTNSKVMMPKDIGVTNAKEHVDINEK